MLATAARHAAARRTRPLASPRGVTVTSWQRRPATAQLEEGGQIVGPHRARVVAGPAHGRLRGQGEDTSERASDSIRSRASRAAARPRATVCFFCPERVRSFRAGATPPLSCQTRGIRSSSPRARCWGRIAPRARRPPCASRPVCCVVLYCVVLCRVVWCPCRALSPSSPASRSCDLFRPSSLSRRRALPRQASSICEAVKASGDGVRLPGENCAKIGAEVGR